MFFRSQRFLAVCGLASALCAVPSLMPAQQPRDGEKRVQLAFVPSIRADLIAGKVTAGHVGVGLRVPFPASNYFSIGGTAAVGGSETGLSGRLDGFGRFSLDPYRRNAWEPYVGAGITIRSDAGGPGTRSYLLGIIGLDGPSTGRIAPGVEVGVGGGIRLGVTLRFTNQSSGRR